MKSTACSQTLTSPILARPGAARESFGGPDEFPFVIVQKRRVDREAST